MFNKKWLLIPMLLIFLLTFSIINGYAFYSFTQQSGENYFVGTADKSDALEDCNENRMILDAFGQLLGHSKYNTTYPADGDTTVGTIQIPEAGLKFDNDPVNNDIAAYVGGEMSWQTKAELGLDLSLYYLKTDINTLSKVEAIYGKDITDSDELATALTDYYLKTAIDTQGEMETIWGVTLLNDITGESIGDLFDVDLTDIADGKILKYNSTTSKFECEDDTGGGNVSTSGTPVQYDYARFVNSTDIEGRSYAETKTDLDVDDLENITNAMDSAGIVTGGVVSEGTNAGTFKVTAITEAYLRTSASATAPLVSVTLAEQDNQTITAADTTYFVVFTYGTPCTITLSETAPNGYNAIPLGKVMKDGSDNVHYIDGGFRFGDGVRKLHQRAKTLRALELESGSAIEYSGTNNFTMEAGIVYGGLNIFSLTVYNSATTQFTYVYDDGGTGWTEVGSNVIDFAHYDDGDGTLGNVGVARYGVHYVYRHVDDGDVYVVYGTGSYTLAEAEVQAIIPPTVPAHLADFGCQIGTIIAPQAGGTFTSVIMVTSQFFSGTEVVNHNNLGGLQGGTAGEEYHLTEAEHTIAIIKKKFDATQAPTVNNDIDEGYEVGSRWVDVTNDKEYVCLDNTDGAAVWTETTGAGGGASTFTGLTDTPSAYTDAGNKLVAVNSGATALEFITDNKVTQTIQDYTIYCNASTGNDTTGDGTSGTPYATIQKAIDSLPTIIAHDVVIAVGADETITSTISFAGHYCAKSLTLKAMDTSDNDLYATGTATSGSSTTLQDTSKSWATDEWNGGWVCIIQGTGVGEVRAITDTTSDTITIASGTTPDSTSLYIIVKVVITGNSLDTGLSGLVDILNIYGFKWSTFSSSIISSNKIPGTGHKSLTIKYNLFDGASGSIYLNGYHSSEVRNNFIKVPSGQYGLTAAYFSSISPRYNCFIANTSGQGYGVYVTGMSSAFMHASQDNTFINLLTGIIVSGNGMVQQGIGQTFSGCTTDYSPSGTSDASYIN